MTPLEGILDLARWAPSGDNSQPWRFAIHEPDRITVYAHDTRATCVYDLDGRSSQIAVGALLETIDLAATRFGLVTTTRRVPESPDERPVFEIDLARDAGLREHPLVGEIPRRRVQRRPLGTRPLSEAERARLREAIGEGYDLRWFEGWRGRARVASLTFRNGMLRLTLPEAFALHRSIVEWDARFSEDRIPDAALGAARPSLALMRWAMASWERVSLLNRWFGGSFWPSLELDYFPGLMCAGHCVLLAPTPPRELDDYVTAGRALQRFWLTASSLYLQFQPLYTPLVFARYVRDGLRFTSHPRSVARSRRTVERLRALLAADDEQRAVFMGRIGAGRAATARSTRLPVERLLVAAGDAATLR